VEYTATYVLRRVDYIGGMLSIGGITCFMMGLQWGASQVSHPHHPSFQLWITRSSTLGAARTTSRPSSLVLSSSLPFSCGSSMRRTPWFHVRCSRKPKRP
jgi:hypothetical protein